MWQREKSGSMPKKQLCGHQGQWRRRWRWWSRCWNRDSPASCSANHGEAAVTLQPMQIQRGADISCPVEQETHIGAGLLTRLVTLLRTHGGAVCSWRTASFGNNTGWSSLWRAVAHGKNSHQRNWRTIPCRSDLMLSRTRIWGILSLERKEWQRKRGMKLPHLLIPIPLHCWDGCGQLGNLWAKLNPGRRDMVK